MPGAASVPFNELLNADQTMKDPAALHAHLRRGRGRRRNARSSPPAAPASPPASWRSAWCGPASRSPPSMTGPGPNGPPGPRPRRCTADAGRSFPKTTTYGFATRMSHAGRAGTHVHGFVNPAVHRGSTVLLPELRGAARRRQAPLRAVHDLRHAGRPDPLRAGGRDRRDRGRHPRADRRHRPRRRRGAAAGLAESPATIA